MATIANDNIIVKFIGKSAQFERERDKLLNTTEGRFKKMADIAGGFLGAQLIQGAVRGIGSLVTKSFELSKNYEQAKISFSVLTGSMKNAEALLERLDRFSLETPFEPTEINNAAKTLLGFGRGLDVVEEDIKLIGNAAAATGGNLESLALVFGQVAGVGKLQGQDALQLINQGLPVYQILAESLDTSVAKVRELQSEGKITFDVLREAFQKASEDGGKFAGALIKQSQSMAGLLSTAQGAFDSLLRLAGDAFLPIAKLILPLIIDGLFTVVNAVKQVGPALESLSTTFLGKLFQAVKPVVESLRDFFGQISDGQSGMQRFSGALTYIARAATALGRVMGLVIDVVKFFYNAISDTRAFKVLVQAFQQLPQIIGGVAAVAEAFPKIFDTSLARAKDFVKAFILDVKNILRVDLIDLITGKKDFSDVFIDGDKLRAKARQTESFVDQIKGAFNRGADEISAIKVELPEVNSEDNKAEAYNQGKDLGNKLAEGIKDGTTEEIIAADSLKGLKDQIAEIQGKIEKISDPEGKGFEELLDNLREVVALETELGRIEGLIARLRGEDKPDIVAPITFDIQAGINEAFKKYGSFEAELQRRAAAAKTGIKVIDVAATQRAAAEALEVTRDFTANIFDLQAESKAREIEVAQSRLDELISMAESGNAEQLQLERERLQKLQNERQRALAAKRQLAAIEISIDTAIAASKSIVAITTAFAEGNVVLGLATAATLAASIGTAALTVTQAFSDLPAFAKGTEYFDPSRTDSTGGAPALLHKGERVMTAEQNRRLMRLGVRNQDIPSLVEQALMVKASPDLPEDRSGAASRELIGRLDRMERTNRQLMKQLSRQQTNVILDREGLAVVTTAAMRRAARRNQLRKG